MDASFNSLITSLSSLSAALERLDSVAWTLEKRKVPVLSQTLSGLVTNFASNLSTFSPTQLARVADAGYAIGLESLLSTFKDENVMLHDYQWAANQLTNVRIKLVCRPAQSTPTLAPSSCSPHPYHSRTPCHGEMKADPLASVSSCEDIITRLSANGLLNPSSIYAPVSVAPPALSSRASGGCGLTGQQGIVCSCEACTSASLRLLYEQNALCSDFPQPPCGEDTINHVLQYGLDRIWHMGCSVTIGSHHPHHHPISLPSTQPTTTVPSSPSPKDPQIIRTSVSFTTIIPKNTLTTNYSEVSSLPSAIPIKLSSEYARTTTFQSAFDPPSSIDGMNDGLLGISTLPKRKLTGSIVRDALSSNDTSLPRSLSMLNHIHAPTYTTGPSSPIALPSPSFVSDLGALLSLYPGRHLHSLYTPGFGITQPSIRPLSKDSPFHEIHTTKRRHLSTGSVGSAQKSPSFTAGPNSGMTIPKSTTTPSSGSVSGGLVSPIYMSQNASAAVLSPPSPFTLQPSHSNPTNRQTSKRHVLSIVDTQLADLDAGGLIGAGALVRARSELAEAAEWICSDDDNEDEVCWSSGLITSENQAPASQSGSTSTGKRYGSTVNGLPLPQDPLPSRLSPDWYLPYFTQSYPLPSLPTSDSSQRFTLENSFTFGPAAPGSSPFFIPSSTSTNPCETVIWIQVPPSLFTQLPPTMTGVYPSTHPHHQYLTEAGQIAPLCRCGCGSSSNPPAIHVVPFFFTQGVNEMQAVAQQVKSAAVRKQLEVNTQGAQRMRAYAHAHMLATYRQVHIEYYSQPSIQRQLQEQAKLALTTANESSDGGAIAKTTQAMSMFPSSADVAAIASSPFPISPRLLACLPLPPSITRLLRTRERALLRQLRYLDETVVNRSDKRDAEVLRAAASVQRLLDCGRVVSCKSAKDRTSMSVTVELARHLESLGVSRSQSANLLDVMRSDGTRRSNVIRNTGKKKYAFNAIQRSMLPLQLTPPPHTCSGNIQS